MEQLVLMKLPSRLAAARRPLTLSWDPGGLAAPGLLAQVSMWLILVLGFRAGRANSLQHALSWPFPRHCKRPGLGQGSKALRGANHPLPKPLLCLHSSCIPRTRRPGYDNDQQEDQDSRLYYDLIHFLQKPQHLQSPTPREEPQLVAT